MALNASRDPDTVPSRLRRLYPWIGIIAAIALVFIFCLSPLGKRYVFSRFRGGELVRSNLERSDQLRLIWQELSNFHLANDRYPTSETDWSLNGGDPSVCDAPKWSSMGDYKVLFPILRLDSPYLVVADVGKKFPGYSEGYSSKPVADDWQFYEDMRVGLFSDGEVRPYGRSDVEAAKAALMAVSDGKDYIEHLDVLLNK